MDDNRGNWCLYHFLLWMLLMAFRSTLAGDFVLIADLENGTIYAGRMGRGLADLAPLPLSGMVRPVATDYDPQERMVYWTDLRSLPSPKVSRANLDGSGQTTVAKDLQHPDGLALDIEARLVYWTDGVLGHVGRVHMNGTGNKEIIVGDLDQPRTIVVDHGRGHIYWTDWGNSPQIERAGLAGGHRTSVVDSDLHWPNGVTVHGDYLYWCDAFLDKIERSDLSGQNRELVMDLSSLGGFHPFDLDVYQGDVFWTDWRVETLLRVHVSGRGLGSFGPEMFQQPGGIHIQEEPDYCESSPCHDGAHCEDDIGGFVCHCPPGLHGITCSDATSCVLPPDPAEVPAVVSRQQAVYLPGDSVQYTCPDGYQLTGQATRTCRSDLTWTGEGTKCQEVNPSSPSVASEVSGCTLPTPGPSDVPAVVSGLVAGHLPGDSVQYTCPDGYQLIGQATRTCRSDLTWTGEGTQTCQKVNPSAGGATRPVPVAMIAAGGSGGAVLIVAVVVVVAVAVKRRRWRSGGRAPSFDTADRTCKDVFPPQDHDVGYSTYIINKHYENQLNEPSYCQTLF